MSFLLMLNGFLRRLCLFPPPLIFRLRGPDDFSAHTSKMVMPLMRLRLLDYFHHLDDHRSTTNPRMVTRCRTLSDISNLVLKYMFQRIDVCIAVLEV